MVQFSVMVIRLLVSFYGQEELLRGRFGVVDAAERSQKGQDLS